MKRWHFLPVALANAASNYRARITLCQRWSELIGAIAGVIAGEISSAASGTISSVAFGADLAATLIVSFSVTLGAIWTKVRTGF